MDLDESISVIYKDTNNEIRQLLGQSQKMLYKCNIIIAIITIILSVSVVVLSYLNYKNNEKWLEVFNSYEYETEVTTYQQDGNGVNSYNSGIMGDITNGADDNNN